MSQSFSTIKHSQKYMVDEDHIVAERIYKTLDLLQDGEWRNVNDIALKVGTSNITRLKKSLEDLVKRNIILSWGNVSDEEKRKIKKEQTREIKRKNNYKINDKGIKKFQKIKNDCSDYETLMILGIKRT